MSVPADIAFGEMQVGAVQLAMRAAQEMHRQQRETLHEQPDYYPIRNHLLDFLVRRSKNFVPPAGYDPRKPPHVTAGKAGGIVDAAD